eukprot:1735504-Pyramimonas_sp.AAC.1
MVSSSVTGMIRICLSLSWNHAAAVFRSTLRHIIKKRIKFCRGELSAEAKLYKYHVMRLFLSSGRNRNFRAVLLNSLPNGDWRNRDFVEYYVRPGEDLDSVPSKLAD